MKTAVRDFARHRGGNVTLVAAIALPVVTGIAGMAVLYIQGLEQKSAIQAGLDSGVLAGTAMHYTASDEQRIAAAEAAFYANVKNGVFLPAESEAEFIASSTGTPKFSVMNSLVSGVAYTKVENSLGAALGIEIMEVKVDATAARQESDPLCLLTLNPDAAQSLYIYGNGTLDADCAAQANSTSSDAIQINGAKSSASASEFGVTGDTSTTSIKPEPIRGTVPTPDPYAELPVPEPESCLMTNALIKDNITLQPGTYCGGLAVKTGAKVRLDPGIYIMLDGQFRIDSGGWVDGDEVMIALVGADSYIYMGSDSRAKLSSPVDGTYKNMQFMSDRDVSGSKFEEEWTTIQSGASLEFDGVAYLPEQNFWVTGTAHQAVIRAWSPSFALIADTIWIQGNAVLDINQKDRRNIGEVAGVMGFKYGAKLVQ